MPTEWTPELATAFNRAFVCADLKGTPIEGIEKFKGLEFFSKDYFTACVVATAKNLKRNPTDRIEVSGTPKECIISGPRGFSRQKGPWAERAFAIFPVVEKFDWERSL